MLEPPKEGAEKIYKVLRTFCFCLYFAYLPTNVPSGCRGLGWQSSHDWGKQFTLDSGNSTQHAQTFQRSPDS